MRQREALTQKVILERAERNPGIHSRKSSSFIRGLSGVNSHFVGPFRLVSLELRLWLVLANYRLQVRQ